MTAALKGESDLSQVAELAGFDFDQVKVKVDVDGRSRTMDLSNPEGIRAQYDVTAEIDLDDTGHPDFDSIDAAARDILEELHEQLGM